MAEVSEPAAFEGQVVVGLIANHGAPAEVGALMLKAVHYPGAQQLILWLPQSGYFGYGALSVTGPADAVESTSVRSRLNGSVQILFDTLPWPPGRYRIEIGHEAGWRHVAELEKLEAGVAPPAPEPPPPPPAAEPAPIVYHDGAGNILPNVDLELRAEARRNIVDMFDARFGPRLEYEGNFRAGTIIYIDAARRIRFWHEMAGGKYKFYINIPTEAGWEAETGAPLAERDAIVRFVADTVQREQASSWSFEIKDNEILFR